jgi:NADH:ubiquinone oxidoreductase subunit 5 (subunit L)/multisubunit Na+/H+ antiporter MnhA subunit
VLEGVNSGAGSHAMLVAVGLLLFIGACGKSAQIPLYVWLPDAMAGPTPVSALIHAATMVTAGVYMVTRMSGLYAHAPQAMAVVAVVGAATAIFAATMGITATDIKKVLAYSTVSQLGYMFAAAGVGAWTAAIFHLMTHAFFKALLFLGAGSVIHGQEGEQDITKMGGPQGEDAGHLRHVHDRDARDRGHRSARRFLLEGRDPLGRVLLGASRGVGGVGTLRPPHGLLHVPAHLPRLLRRSPR